MKVDFSQIKENPYPEFKGGIGVTNLKTHEDDLGKIMRGRLEPGACIGMHTHENNSEIIFILEGECKALYDGEGETLKAGDCHYCPQGHSHSLINNGNKDLIFYAVVAEINCDDDY